MGDGGEVWGTWGNAWVKVFEFLEKNDSLGFATINFGPRTHQECWLESLGER